MWRWEEAPEIFLALKICFPPASVRSGPSLSNRLTWVYLDSYDGEWSGFPGQDCPSTGAHLEDRAKSQPILSLLKCAILPKFTV